MLRFEYIACRVNWCLAMTNRKPSFTPLCSASINVTWWRQRCSKEAVHHDERRANKIGGKYITLTSQVVSKAECQSIAVFFERGKQENHLHWSCFGTFALPFLTTCYWSKNKQGSWVLGL